MDSAFRWNQILIVIFVSHFYGQRILVHLNYLRKSTNFFNQEIIDLMKINNIFYILLFLLTAHLSAQTVCQEQLDANNEIIGYSIGQSVFMPDCSGLFSSIELYRSTDGEEIVAELLILTGQTFIGTPRYSQTIIIPQSAGPFIVDFDGGVGSLEFFEDSQYTFIISHPDLQLQANGDEDSYLNGQMFLDVGFINNDDLWFKLSIGSTLEIDQQVLNQPSLTPNPASNYMRLSGIQSRENYTIFNVLGIKEKNGWVSNDEIIYTHDLSNGLYFLKLDSGETLKFLKK